MMKYAIRIIDGDSKKTTLFAVCTTEEEAYRHRQLARITIPVGSYKWTTINDWSPEFSSDPYRRHF